MCRQFSCLPSQLYKEDSELLRLLRIEALGTPQQEMPGEYLEDYE